MLDNYTSLTRELCLTLTTPRGARETSMTSAGPSHPEVSLLVGARYMSTSSPTWRFSFWAESGPGVEGPPESGSG